MRLKQGEDLLGSRSEVNQRTWRNKQGLGVRYEWGGEGGNQGIRVMYEWGRGGKIREKFF